MRRWSSPRSRYVRCHREVFAGEQLTYSVEMLVLREEGASVRGQVHVGEELIVEAEIFFAHLDQTRAGAIFGDRNFVFSSGLGDLLQLDQFT